MKLNNYVVKEVKQMLSSLYNHDALTEIRAEDFSGFKDGEIYVNCELFTGHLPMMINVFEKSGEWLDSKGYTNDEGEYSMQYYDFDLFNFKDLNLIINGKISILEVNHKLDIYLKYLKESLNDSINEIDGVLNEND